MENMIQVLEYTPSLSFYQGDTQLIKPAAPKIWLPLETALLKYLTERVQAGEFGKDDAVYNQAYRRIKENPDVLIFWICKSSYQQWKHLMTVPDCRIMPEDQQRWEDGWSNPEHWNVEDYQYIHGENFITHDRKIVKPVGRVRRGDHNSVFAIPNPQDPDGIYNLALAYSTGDQAHFISLSENYINLPLLQQLPEGGYRPGAEFAQVVLALRYHIEVQAASDPLNQHYENILVAINSILSSCDALAHDRATMDM